MDRLTTILRKDVLVVVAEITAVASHATDEVEREQGRHAGWHNKRVARRRPKNACDDSDRRVPARVGELALAALKSRYHEPLQDEML